MNFLKGRVTPSEPIGHCGVVSRRSKVVVVGTCATPALFPNISASKKNYELFTDSDAEAMMKTIKLRFETHFDIYERLIFLDAFNLNSAGMKLLRSYLQTSRDSIVDVIIYYLNNNIIVKIFIAFTTTSYDFGYLYNFFSSIKKKIR